MRHHKKHYKHIEKKTIYNTPNTKNKRHHSGLEISAGHRSLTGKISQLTGKYRRLADMRDR
jgi:hypothetical protein